MYAVKEVEGVCITYTGAALVEDERPHDGPVVDAAQQQQPAPRPQHRVDARPGAAKLRLARKVCVFR